MNISIVLGVAAGLATAAAIIVFGLSMWAAFINALVVCP